MTKKFIILLYILVNTFTIYAQSKVESKELSDSIVSSVEDSIKALETQMLQSKLEELRIMQEKLDELEIQRENDSIKNTILSAEVTRLSGITNASDNDTTKLNSEAIKRNIIKSRLATVIDLSDDLHYVAKGFPVIGAKSDTLFLIYANAGGLSAKERVENINSKIQMLYNDDFFDETKLQVVEFGGSYDIVYDKTIIINISPADGKVHGISAKRLATDSEWLIRNSITLAKKDGSLLKWILRIALALFVLIISMLVIRLVGKGYDKLLIIIDKKKDVCFKDLSYRSYTFLTAQQELKGTYLGLRLFSWVLYALLLYITLPVLFSIFPFSRGWADILFQLIWSPFKKVLLAVWNYFPDLFSILVIYLIMRYVVKFVKYIFAEIHTGKLKISGFHTDWARPTFQIVKFLLYAFMFVMIFPFLPNSESEIFKGVSMFLGLLLSLGSSSAISNMVSGLVITYMRPFMLGDRIKINDVAGDVIEKTLLVTRIKTVKNEIITIPNSSILSGNTTNYSFEARNKGLIVYTSVTIGYDVPWKKMHEALIEAALRTDMILNEPKPFVLQTSLEDFYVAYQLNAYTQEASKQAIIYSNLHANIQDVCNEQGIEILSPHYRAARDGNTTTIPASYLPADYEAPHFNVKVETDK